MGEGSSISYRKASPSIVGSFLNEYAIQIKITIIAIATILIYFKDIYITGVEALSSDYYNYVVLIPILSGYLIYRKRKMLAAVLPVRDEHGNEINIATGLGALVVCIILYMYGAVTSSPEDYHLISLQIFLGASVLLLFNRQTLRILLLPIILISAALPSIIESGLSYWNDMAFLSAYPAAAILRFFGLNVSTTVTGVGPSINVITSNGNTLSFVVSVASSGIYSLVGASLFFAFVGYIAKGELWKKITLFICAYPLLLAVNIARESILVSVAFFFGQSVFEAFHATSGIVLVFILTFILLVVGERLFKLQIIPSSHVTRYCSLCAEQFKNRNGFCANCGRFLNNKLTRIQSKDFISFVAIVLVVLVFFSPIIPSITVADAPIKTSLNSINSQNALHFLPQVKGWNLTFIQMDSEVVSALRADAAMDYEYTSVNNSVIVNAVVQITSEIHIPQTSLQYNCLAFRFSCANFYVYPEDVELVDQPPLVGQFMVFQDKQTFGSEVEALFYWQENALFNLSSSYATRVVQVQLIASMRVLTQSGIIRNANDYTGAENYLLPLAKATAEYWSAKGSSGNLTFGVKHWSSSVVAIAVLPSVILIGKDGIRRLERFRRRDKLRKTIIYPNLSLDLRELLDQLHNFQLEQNKKDASTGMTLEKIISSYKARTEKEITFLDALTAMTYAENIGIARKRISDINDEPILTWKLT